MILLINQLCASLVQTFLRAIPSPGQLRHRQHDRSQFAATVEQELLAGEVVKADHRLNPVTGRNRSWITINCGIVAFLREHVDWNCKVLINSLTLKVSILNVNNSRRGLHFRNVWRLLPTRLIIGFPLHFTCWCDCQFCCRLLTNDSRDWNNCWVGFLQEHLVPQCDHYHHPAGMPVN